jgi:hypothetical protein
MPTMTITDVYDYIINQPKGEALFNPVVEIGQIDVPNNFLEEIIKNKQFEGKYMFGQPGKMWKGATEWYFYITKPRHTDCMDPDFSDINAQIIQQARKFIPDFDIASSSVFSLEPGGYIIPHIDRPGNPNELYMAFNWPEGVHLAWKSYGEIHPVCHTVYAFDTHKEHAIVNMSDEVRYVYIVSPVDTESLKPIFTSNNTSL